MEKPISANIALLSLFLIFSTTIIVAAGLTEADPLTAGDHEYKNSKSNNQLVNVDNNKQNNGGSYQWGWGGGGGGGGGGGSGGGGGGGGGWGGGGGGGGYWRWGSGCGRSHGEKNRRNKKKGIIYGKEYIIGEYAECMGAGRCHGMRLDCPLHCGGPCFYDCTYMCKAHCRWRQHP